MDLTVLVLSVPLGELGVGFRLYRTPQFLTEMAPPVHLEPERSNVIGSPLKIPEKKGKILHTDKILENADGSKQWQIKGGGALKPAPTSFPPTTRQKSFNFMGF